MPPLRPLAVGLVCAPLVLAGCAVFGGGDEDLTPRERRAAGLVLAERGDAVTCHDNGAVNSELAPEHPIGYSCFNDAGEFYNAVVTPDGVLLSVSGPARLTPADE